jgi:outer membrane receptor protein involved in Fe transport
MRNRLLIQTALATMLFGSAIFGSLVSPARAQDAGAAKEAASAEAAAKAKADKEKADKAAGTTQIEEIVVTANRRDQGVQKVSGVVQSITGDQIRKDGISDVRQLQAAIPGLSIANQEGNVEIYIRGVGSSNNTELGDPGAAPHLNGIYIPRPRGLGLQSMILSVSKSIKVHRVLCMGVMPWRVL